MKQILTACTLAGALIFTINCGSDAAGGGITMYVTANSGLLIRADATTNSNKLGLVPYGEKVSVLEQSEKTMTISGKTGHWTKINYNGTEGWCFGGFLSATPPGPKPVANPLVTKCAKHVQECNTYCEGAGPDDGCETIECLNLINDSECYNYVDETLFGRSVN